MLVGLWHSIEHDIHIELQPYLLFIVIFLQIKSLCIQQTGLFSYQKPTFLPNLYLPIKSLQDVKFCTTPLITIT